MALTPQDIQSQQFHVRFRGFDVDEVDDFLEKVAEDYLTAIQENKQLKERLEEMKNELSSYRHQGKSFQKAFVSAQQMADEMMEKSEKQAADIVSRARQEAEQLQSEAQQEIMALERQLDQLKEQKNGIRDELRTTLTGYLERLDEVFDTTTATPTDSLTSRRILREDSDAASFLDDLGAEEEDEEDDLYEKVDLTDDFRLPDEDELPGFGTGPIYSQQETPDEGEEALPDIEGEMVFSLDDPLDDLTPDIKINDGESEER